MAFIKQTKSPGEVISSDWANHIQTQYDEINAQIFEGNRTSTERKIYIDQINGNDSNDGFSAATALKTAKAAFAKIPKYVEAYYTVYFIGDYTGDIVVPPFQGMDPDGAQLLIRSQYTATPSTINGTLTVCGAGGWLEGVRFDSITFQAVTGTNSAVNVVSSPMVYFYKCNFKGSAGTGNGLTAFGSSVYLKNCTVDSGCYGGLSAQYGAHIASYATTGAAAYYGLMASFGGRISKISTQPTGGTAAESASLGGVIS